MTPLSSPKQLMTLALILCHITLGTALLSSCSLDEEPHDQIPEEEAYTNTKTVYLNTVATLYNYIGGYAEGQGLQGPIRGVYDLQTFGSDEAMIPTRGGDWYDGGLWQAMYKHSWTAGHEIPKNAWVYLYKVITLCNNSLEKLEKHQDLAGEYYYEWQSEVRALRAMYYWYLIDLFGDVPLMINNDVSMNEVKRESRAKVFQFCVDELTEVASGLAYEKSTQEGDFYSRITRPVAYFVLAKLMLGAEVYTGKPRWEDCIKYCNEISNMGFFQLEPDYSSNFMVYNQNSTENIFTIPMNKILFSNQQQNIIRSLHYRHAGAYGYGGENGSCATLKTLKVFGYPDDPDIRFYYNYHAGKVSGYDEQPVLQRTGQPLIYYPEEVRLDLRGSKYLETAGARMYKYQFDKNAMKDGKLVDNDIVLFRYADVLLMRAECKERLGQDGSDDFNAVRSRSTDEKRECTLDNILDERLLELCWEGWRRPDLIRFHQYKSLYDGPDAVDESDGHTTLYPIPADVRALNQNLTQNPGY